MTQTIHAIYDTLVAMKDFIKILTGWFGFGPIVALIGLLFFFKIFQSIFPTGRIINFIFSFCAFTALWLTWNMNYYKSFEILTVIRIYGFIFLNAAALYLIYWLLQRVGHFIYRFVKNRKLTAENILLLYEKIDETALIMKQKLKLRDISGASASLDELRESFKVLQKKETVKQQNNS